MREGGRGRAAGGRGEEAKAAGIVLLVLLTTTTTTTTTPLLSLSPNVSLSLRVVVNFGCFWGSERGE